MVVFALYLFVKVLHEFGMIHYIYIHIYMDFDSQTVERSTFVKLFGENSKICGDWRNLWVGWRFPAKNIANTSNSTELVEINKSGRSETAQLLIFAVFGIEVDGCSWDCTWVKIGGLQLNPMSTGLVPNPEK